MSYYLITIKDSNLLDMETIAINCTPGEWLVDFYSAVDKEDTMLNLIHSVEITKEQYNALEEIYQ